MSRCDNLHGLYKDVPEKQYALFKSKGSKCIFFKYNINISSELSSLLKEPSREYMYNPDEFTMLIPWEFI